MNSRPLRYLLAPPLLVARKFGQLTSPTSEPSLRILILHDVQPAQMSDLDRLLGHLKLVYGIITPERAAKWLAGESDGLDKFVSNAPFLITFDDGFVSNLSAARQVLEVHDVKALFFICPGLVELPLDQQIQKISENIFDGKFASGTLSEGQRLMSWEKLNELQSIGHTIGAHGMSHRRLSSLKGSELETEIATCAGVLEGQLGQKTDWYAYAFGDAKSISARALQIIGKHFKFCRSGVRGLNHRGYRLLFAEEMGLDQPFNYQKLVADGGLDFMHRKNRALLTGLAVPPQ